MHFEEVLHEFGLAFGINFVLTYHWIVRILEIIVVVPGKVSVGSS